MRILVVDDDDDVQSAVARTLRVEGHAVVTAPGGSTVVLRGGVYREVVEVPATRRLTLQAAPGEVVWLSGSDEVTGWAGAGGVWVHTGFSSPFTAGTLNPTLVNPTSPMAGDPDMVFVDGAPLRQVGSRTDVVPGTFFVDDAAQALVVGDDPTGRRVEVSVRNEALNVRSEGSVVRGIGFRHYATHISRLGAVKAGAAGITFENDVFQDNAAAGLSVMAPEPPYLAAWANYPTGKWVVRTLADLRAKTGQEGTTRITDDAATNPYVADADSGRYGLPAGSSLAAAGVALPASVAAAVGVPAGAPVPVGILPPA